MFPLAKIVRLAPSRAEAERFIAHAAAKILRNPEAKGVIVRHDRVPKAARGASNPEQPGEPLIDLLHVLCSHPIDEVAQRAMISELAVLIDILPECDTRARSCFVS